MTVESSSRRSQRAVTLHDVARRAGVSPMTASRVLNGDPKVSADRRARVLDAVGALNYRPNSAAKSLASASSWRIALLYSNPSSAFLSEFLLGCLEASSAGGAQLVVEPCESAKEQRAAIRKMAAAGADGFVLSPPISESEAARDLLESLGRPTVAVASARRRPSVSLVRIDDFEAARAMTQRLIDLGHRRIAFIMGHPHGIASQQRHDGFLAAMKEAGLETDPALTVPGLFSYRSGFEAAQALLDRNIRPTAIFASNDDMAAGAIAYAHKLGLSVPRDLTVVGFDDTAMAIWTWPSLTTVRQPIAEMSRLAVQMLLDQLRRQRGGDSADPAEVVLPFDIIARESDAPPAN